MQKAFSTPENEFLSEIDIIPFEIRKLLLLQNNGMYKPYDLSKTINELFVEWRIINSSKIAISFGSNCLNYGELDGYINHLAFLLHSMGISKGEIIPIMFDDCFELPIAIMALLKIGAVFVPLDRNWPKELIKSSVKELEARYILSKQDYFQKENMSISFIDCSLNKLLSLQSYPSYKHHENDLVYGFFTSGSSGKPKCCLNKHKGLMNRFMYMSEKFLLHDSDVILKNSKTVFDSALWQLLWPLIIGKTVYLPKRDNTINIKNILDEIFTNSIVMTDFVPSIFNLLIEYLVNNKSELYKLSSIKFILIGGEKADSKYVKIFFELFPNIKLFNTYGHTEASIGMVFHEIDGCSISDEIPLGTPIPNTYVAILDEFKKLVPPSVVGEIYVGGDCVGQGYLNRIELNKLSFIENFIPEIPGATLFKTGDYGYWGKDNKLYYNGRKDSQVKINGVRIDLEEIEICLSKEKGIKQIKAIVNTNKDVHEIIVFYVSDDEMSLEDRLRSNINKTLPKEMWPNRLLRLEKIPLTHNGKTNFQKLKKMVKQPRIVKSDISDSINKKIENIWTNILGHNDFDSDSNFFSVGGDSLKAIRMILKTNIDLKVNLDLGIFDENLNINKMGNYLKGNFVKKHSNSTINLILDDISNFSSNNFSETEFNISPKICNVFLTGATGYFGSHILNELLGYSSEIRCYCLVRADNIPDGIEKIINSFKEYKIWSEDFQKKIVVIIGDIQKRNFGLNEIELNKVFTKVDAIIHNGALVDFIKEYKELRNVNVISTYDILKISSKFKIKRNLYISSIGLSEIDNIDRFLSNSHEMNGYMQTKMVSEFIIREFRKKNKNISIIRFGELMPSSKTGVPNSKSMVQLLISSITELGICPSIETKIDYMPVDKASNALIKILFSDTNLGVYNIFNKNGITISELFKNIEKIKKCQFDDFLSELRLKTHNDSNGKFSKLLYFMLLAKTKNYNELEFILEKIDLINAENVFDNLEEYFVSKSINKYFKHLNII